ncbi:hypothetical protein OOT55_11195 [Marinimicrobium sp. C6131]|uniref:hypothetical protein n=1 Tax=Marinimicrobium sp. C6131 TaxID=3022676 RepID=UPI00223E3126|nr:hypothetical protein [Marinimicrobium sp. C6131]UZJ43215.1 hypothetical protein OOT55_11195 [Marinimicrobium sp. C6131]
MTYKAGLFCVILLSGLTGCAQLVTDRYLDRHCDKSHVDCPGRAVVDRKAQKADMAALRAIGEQFEDKDNTPEPDPPYRDSAEPLCPDGQKKVCSASTGCRCEPD